MSQLLFIWSVTSYLLSLAFSLLLSFFYKEIPVTALRTFIGIHLSLLTVWLIFRDSVDTLNDPGPSNFLFLFFICSGVLLSGVMLRSTFSLLLKCYFSIYLISVIVFLFSPSWLLGFIASGKPGAMDTGSLRLYENVYLVKQQSTLTPHKGLTAFKITREMGVFHKTLSRDILLPFIPDSVIARPLSDNKGVAVTFHYPCNSKVCSLDTILFYGIKRDSSKVITRKPLIP